MKQYVVVGLGKLGTKVATTLVREGGDVVAIDRDMDRVEEVKDQVGHAICLDITDEDDMASVGIEGVSAAVVAIGEDQEASIMCTAILKRLGVPLIVARANSDLHGRILELVGATRVIYAEDQVGEDVAMGLVRSNVREWFTLPTGHTVAELVPSASFSGKPLRDLGFRDRFGVNVISIRSRRPAVGPAGESTFREHYNNRPGPEDLIQEGDSLVVVGPGEGVEALSRTIAEEMDRE